MIASKPYAKHIIEPYFAIDTVHPDVEDFQQVEEPIDHSSSRRMKLNHSRSIDWNNWSKT